MYLRLWAITGKPHKTQPISIQNFNTGKKCQADLKSFCITKSLKIKILDGYLLITRINPNGNLNAASTDLSEHRPSNLAWPGQWGWRTSVPVLVWSSGSIQCCSWWFLPSYSLQTVNNNRTTCYIKHVYCLATHILKLQSSMLVPKDHNYCKSVWKQKSTKLQT